MSRDPFLALIPQFDVVFTYGGGEPVQQAYKALGARECQSRFTTRSIHRRIFRCARDPRFTADLSFLGNRLPDREDRVDEFFLKPAAAMPERMFLLGGAGWGDKRVTPNVRYFDHVYTRDHNAFNCTPRAVINISRESMARYGYSPATRVFEAAGAAACIVTDEWIGIGQFLEPGKEILVAANAEQVVEHLIHLSSERARAMGEAARRRVLAHHTYAQRAEQVERILEGKRASAAGASS